ncbi:MAG: alpha/beta hydrolase [Dehalococcoidia bacterium]|nr:alpha/beta hydrolase [Dehalococcoidia bacterium]
MEEVTPQEGWLNTSGLRMHYLDWSGTPSSHGQDNRPAVVALHGLASSCHWYDLVIPRLADNYRCISLDQRGHGLTDQPPTGYDWHTLSTDVVEALTHLGVREAAVMGHSWGGYVALSLAAKYPEHVSKLVMVDGGFMDWTRWPGATWEWFTNLLRPRDVSGTREEFLDRLRHQLAECWSDQLEEIVMTMVRVGPDGLVRDILEPTNHAQVLDAMWNEPPSSMFHLVRCPTMIMSAGPRAGGGNSEFSRMRREMADAAQSAIGDCRVEWIPDTIHDIGYHKPDEMAKALNAFLSR